MPSLPTAPASPTPDDPRRRILDAAGLKFAEKGFDATNVREITEIAGASPGAVNYYFRSKEELYIQAVRHAAASCDAAVPMPTWPADVPPRDKLRDFIRAFLSRLLRQDVPAWCRVLIMREVAEPRPGACEEFVRNFVRPTFNVLNSILREMVPPSLSLDELHLFGNSIVGQCLHYHHARHVISLLVGPEEYARYEIERLTTHIHRFSLAALEQLYPTTNKGDRP